MEDARVLEKASNDGPDPNVFGAAGDSRSKVDLSGKDVMITVDLSAGPESASILTTDLTAEYVHENSAYST